MEKVGAGAVAVATVVGVVIAAIALIPAFGQWLFPRTLVAPNNGTIVAPASEQANDTSDPQSTATQGSPSPSPTSEPPTATPTPAPTSIPVGATLYPTDESSGLDKWFRTSDWNFIDGMLVSDGTVDEALPWRELRWLAAPYEPDSIVNYAVEAEIQAGNIGNLGNYPCGNPSFGIVVRSSGDEGYQVGALLPLLEYCGTGGAARIAAFWKDPDQAFWKGGGQTLAEVAFDPGTDWHTYRVEVKGNTITLLIDGQQALKTTDNRYLSGGKGGLWFDGVQISVRSFKVIKL